MSERSIDHPDITSQLAASTSLRFSSESAEGFEILLKLVLYFTTKTLIEDTALTYHTLFYQEDDDRPENIVENALSDDRWEDDLISLTIFTLESIGIMPFETATMIISSQ